MTEEFDPLVDMMLRVYTNEPCRICEQILTMEDIRAGAVFAGYSKKDGEARATHKRCWNNAIEIIEQLKNKP